MPKNSAPLIVALTTSIDTAQAIGLVGEVIGEIMLDATLAAGVTALTWYTSFQGTQTYVIAYDVGTNGVQTVAAGRGYRFPVELAGASHVKVTGSATGTLHINLKG